VDSKDRQIVAALQANGRMSNQELSERVNLSLPPVGADCGDSKRSR